MNISDFLPSEKVTMAKDKPTTRESIPAKINIGKLIMDKLSSLLGNKAQTPVSDPEQAVRTTTPAVLPTVKPTVTPTITPAVTETPTVTARNPAVSNYVIPDSVHKAIKVASDTFKLNPSILYDVALQESSFDPNLVNTTPAGKKAGNPTGLYQFTDNTWKTILNSYNDKLGMSLHLPTTDRTDPTTNAMAAAYLIKMGQLGRWNASQGVWGPQYTQDETKPYYAQTEPDRVPSKNWKKS